MRPGATARVEWGWAWAQGTVTLGRQAGFSADLTQVHRVGSAQRKGLHLKSKTGSGARWTLGVLRNRAGLSGTLCREHSTEEEAAEEGWISGCLGLLGAA